MIIIIEGPDCAGKSQLAEAFARAMPSGSSVNVIHAGPPDPPGRSPFEEYELGLRAAAQSQPGNALLIFDRWALGEVVYGPLLRGMSRLTSGGLLHCEMLAEAHGALRLMMMPALHTLLGRLHERGDALIDAVKMAYIRDSYAKLRSRYAYLHFHNPPDMATLEYILSIARQRTGKAADIAAVLPGYIGTTTPAMIFAGDVRSKQLDPDPYMHAFTPAVPGSALYLMDALATVSPVVLRHAGICNTGEEGADLSAADELLRSPRWVALGNHAEARLRSAGITPRKVHHPSFERRFMLNRQTPAEYANAILAEGVVA